MKGGIKIAVKNSDIKLNGTSTIVEGFEITANVCDFRLDHPDRRRKNIQTSDYRRALVHDFQDGLTLNWGEDYPGGVTIQGNVQIPNQLTASHVQIPQLTASDVQISNQLTASDVKITKQLTTHDILIENNLDVEGCLRSSKVKTSPNITGIGFETTKTNVTIEDGRINISEYVNKAERYNYDLARLVINLLNRVEYLEKKLEGK